MSNVHHCSKLYASQPRHILLFYLVFFSWFEIFQFTGSLSNWLPPPSLTSVAFISCDLQPLLDPCVDAGLNDVWGGVASLHISQCLLQQLPRVISLFSSLTSLNLSNSSIGDSDLFLVLPSLPPRLLSIDLSHNPLTSLSLSNVLVSNTMLQTLRFMGCRFLPSSSNLIADSIRRHPALSSIALQVDASASAVRVLHAACNRPTMLGIHVEASYTAACQHVLSFSFSPLTNIESIAIINVPIHIPWLHSLQSSCARNDSSQSSTGGLRCLRLVNNGMCLFLCKVPTWALVSEIFPSTPLLIRASCCAFRSHP